MTSQFPPKILLMVVLILGVSVEGVHEGDGVSVASASSASAGSSPDSSPAKLRVRRLVPCSIPRGDSFDVSSDSDDGAAVPCFAENLVFSEVLMTPYSQSEFVENISFVRSKLQHCQGLLLIVEGLVIALYKDLCSFVMFPSGTKPGSSQFLPDLIRLRNEYDLMSKVYCDGIGLAKKLRLQISPLEASREQANMRVKVGCLEEVCVGGPVLIPGREADYISACACLKQLELQLDYFCDIYDGACALRESVLEKLEAATEGRKVARHVFV